MPLDKLSLYANGVKRQIAYRRRESVVDLVNAIGISLSGKGLDKYLKTLEGPNG